MNDFKESMQQTLLGEVAVNLVSEGKEITVEGLINELKNLLENSSANNARNECIQQTLKWLNNHKRHGSLHANKQSRFTSTGGESAGENNSEDGIVLVLDNLMHNK